MLMIPYSSSLEKVASMPYTPTSSLLAVDTQIMGKEGGATYHVMAIKNFS